MDSHAELTWRACVRACGLASEARACSLPSSYSRVICQWPYQEVLLPASPWGQCWAVDDFLLSPPTAPNTCCPPHCSIPLPQPPPPPSPPSQAWLTSSTWGPSPSRMRCAASAFFCGAKRRKELNEDSEQAGPSTSGMKVEPHLQGGLQSTLQGALSPSQVGAG